MTGAERCIGLVLLLAGCTVGPDFVRPESPPVAEYTTKPVTGTVGSPGVSAGEAQNFVDGADIPAQWWQLFQSPALNDIVQRTLDNNHDLKAATAALAQAHETVLAQRAAYYPDISGGLAAGRSRSSAALAPTPSSGALLYSLYTPEVSVGFVPDVFGLNRRLVESLQAQEEQSRFQLRAAYLALSANAVVTAIEGAALRAQITAAQALIDFNEHSLAMLRQQQIGGYAGLLDVATQEGQLAQARTALPPLLKQLAQQRDLLAEITGARPSDPAPVELQVSQLHLPQQLPLSLPSLLLQQRPDVRQAEENLHAASAQIGVAAANRLPTFNITADAGLSALTLGALTSGGNGFWDLGAAVSQPIFQGGALMHRERAARDAYEVASEQYQSTVLVAFQNVADTLAALEHDAEALRAAAQSADAAQAALQLVRAQQRVGYTGYLQLLNAEQLAQIALVSEVQAQFNRYADTVALFQALGGGWWNRSEGTAGATASVRQAQ